VVTKRFDSPYEYREWELENRKAIQEGRLEYNYLLVDYEDEKSPIKPLYKRRCNICGRWFIPSSGNRLKCPRCVADGNQEYRDPFETVVED